MKKIIDNLSTENRFSFYAAFFRIFISFHLLKKLFLSWQYKDLLYSPTSFYSHEKSYLLDFLNIESQLFYDNFELFYFSYFILLVLFFFGFGKGLTAFILYVCIEILQSFCPTILNGGDNLLKFIMLYMIFIDSYNYFATKKTSIILKPTFFNFTSNIAGYSICIHLCLVYFISAIHKIHADVWFNGIATYYTLSLERFRGTSFNINLAKNGFFVTLSTYGTILIELFYPVLIWIEKTRKIILVFAVILHIFIYILMMIYDFQIVFIFVQGFFIKNHEWLKLKDILDNSFKKIKYVYAR